jgi:hypothetical protein
MRVSQEAIGPLDRRAVCDQRRFREASLAEQTGWWFNHKKRILLELEPPPASLKRRLRGIA